MAGTDGPASANNDRTRCSQFLPMCRKHVCCSRWVWTHGRRRKGAQSYLLLDKDLPRYQGLAAVWLALVWTAARAACSRAREARPGPRAPVQLLVKLAGCVCQAAGFCWQGPLLPHAQRRSTAGLTGYTWPMIRPPHLICLNETMPASA